ncbi:MAG TPA: SGNH/GDSL hydrolase family protein [Stellaceae bacterium]|nr:SGNH/GDSL hydrolase family protein [Stellaceae bacterium]
MRRLPRRPLRRLMCCCPLGNALAAALVVAVAGAAAAAEPGSVARTACAAPPTLVAIGRPLAHSAARLARGDGLTIVAVGSSSTQGIGSTAPNLSYPSRLQAELSQRFPDAPIRVINRGKSGEDAPEEVARLTRDVIVEHPDLVIWQVGTNAVLRRDDLSEDGERLEHGVAQLQEGGSDIVLMDMQYAPRVIARPSYSTMERLIADAAKSSRVGLFRRFDIMRYWQTEGQPNPPPMVGADRLHMTDEGYGCLAADLADALAENWRAQQRVAGHPKPATVAGLAAAR